MKAILIFTAALMTGASIYGVASYKQLSGTRDFKELYTDKKESGKTEPSTVVNAVEKQEPAIAETKKPQRKIGAAKKIKRKIIVAEKEEVKNEPVATEAPSLQQFSAQESSAEVKSEEVKEVPAATKEQPKKVKKLKRNMFSRAALKDE